MSMPPVTLPLLAASQHVPLAVRLVHRVVQEAAERIEGQHPSAGFWGGSLAERQAAFYVQLYQYNRFVTHATWGKVNACFGVLFDRSPGEHAETPLPRRYDERFPWLRFWLETNPQAAGVRASLRELLTHFGQRFQEQGWQYIARDDAWPLLHRLRSVVEVLPRRDPAEALIEWFVESFVQLREGGVIERLERLASPEVGESRA